MAKQISQQQILEDAFKLVQNKKHWKNPINCTIADPGAKTLGNIETAVIHFTGSVATVTKLRNGKIRVVADGYYLTIGA